MKRIPISLTLDQHERLQREAHRRRSSVAHLVREAVDEVYPDEGERRRQARIRAREVIGKFRGGPADLSERHDDYLAELDRW